MTTSSTAAISGDRVWHDIGSDLRVIIVAGIPVGVLVAGFGSRLVMLVLRVTSPDSVRGVTSDDGFTIGDVTLTGTYNLLLLGATVGIIGAAVYKLVAPWLIGPSWFRRLTTGAAAAVVAGSGLVHADGVDFTLLKPTWLTVGLFVLLPGVFGVLVGVAVDSVSRPGSWTARGRRQWVLPVIAVACFPLSAFAVVIVAVVLACWAPFRYAASVRQVRRLPAYGLVIRGIWLLIAVAGAIGVANDINALA